MHAVLKEIEKIGIVPVIKIDRVEDAVPLAGALIKGHRFLVFLPHTLHQGLLDYHIY